MIRRFQIQLADVDRSVYQELDLRVAQHPSEDEPYLLTRVLAMALEWQEGLEFSRGLSEADEPALWRKSPDGRLLDWIEVGNPAPDRLHRAAKAAERVVVYAHRRADQLVKNCQKERVHRADEIRLVRVPEDLLGWLLQRLDRNNRWDLSVLEGTATLVVGGEAQGGVFQAGPLLPAE